MRVFTLTVLPTYHTQMSVLTKKLTVLGDEDRPRQNGPQVLPISKIQGRQVRFISCSHSYSPPCGVQLGQRFFLFTPPPPLLLLPPPILGALPPADRLPAMRLAREIGKIGTM